MCFMVDMRLVAVVAVGIVDGVSFADLAITALAVRRAIFTMQRRSFWLMSRWMEVPNTYFVITLKLKL